MTALSTCSYWKSTRSSWNRLPLSPTFNYPTLWTPSPKHNLKPIYFSLSLNYKPSPSLQHFGRDYCKSLPNGLLASNASPVNSIQLVWCFNTMSQILPDVAWLPVYICLVPLSCLSPTLWSSFLLSLPQTHQAQFHLWRSALTISSPEMLFPHLPMTGFLSSLRS